MAVASSAPVVTEALVAWIWERQLLKGPLRCCDGRIVQVVYPGRQWGEGRPDFQGAVLAWQDGTLTRGDVEVHQRAGHWWAHRHHTDPAYNRVVLHVVLWGAQTGPIRRADGSGIPTLALLGALARPLPELMAEHRNQAIPLLPPCQAEPVGTGDVSGLLKRAGLERFNQKSARFESELAALQPSEVLYRAVARALGYTANAAAFASLAERVPLGRLLETTAVRGDPSRDRLSAQAALLGSAGLLPSQRRLAAVGRWPSALEERWSSLESHGWHPVVGPEAWTLGGVRPANSPPRRLVALAELALAWARGDPAGQLADGMLATADRPARLIERWRVRAGDDYWPGAADFQRRIWPVSPWLVGRGRAAEIVVNVVLPLAAALGQTWGHAELSEIAQAAYTRMPRTPGNTLTRGMARQILGRSIGRELAGACRQQGLLHLYRRHCEGHYCDRCPARPAERGACASA